ncbi:Hypothetical predicted protein [Mytilus galloprovincialis]|uniref:EGF-like domain-containing protein n=1 Tax=Mytilus galloprovincialis TaxID=29158 RepID=A0A8B6EKH6_MYTGA|nr:Hypothetical predicted protein [Mytilus galloprovincialis]
MEKAYILIIIITIEYLFGLKFTECVTINKLKTFQRLRSNEHRTRRSLKGIRDFSWVERVPGKNIGDAILNPLTKELRVIGIFLAAHKYFEVDRRYTFTSSQFENPKFYKHFPTPRLRKRHQVVVGACELGYLPCVEEIFKTANHSGSLAKIHKNFGKNAIRYASYYPFKDSLELFRYRVTASYYMCWFTEMREDVLALPGTNNCFKDLNETEEAGGKNIEDFRSEVKISEEYSIFTCAYLWFCPDSCYGKSSGGNVKSKEEALDDHLNPCGELQKKDCLWGIGKNKNFEDLVRNKFNYSCDCEFEKKGMVWSPMYSFCVDRDECYEEDYDCPTDQICRNTVGSYMCSCRTGYYLDKNTTRCKRHDLLNAAAASALERKKTEKAVEAKKEEGGSLYVLKLLVEIIRGHCPLHTITKPLLILCFSSIFLLVL